MIHDVIYLSGWKGSDWGTAIRTIYTDGTLYLIAQDIDALLGKSGHGHTLTGMPAEAKRKFTIGREHRRVGERSCTFTAVKIPALKDRMLKMRSLSKEEKEAVGEWLKIISLPILWHNKMCVWRESANSEWRGHKTKVSASNQDKTWVWVCLDCAEQGIPQEYNGKGYSRALVEASRHANSNAILQDQRP